MTRFEDVIEAKIEADGTISFTTDKVSKENHQSADQFINETFEAIGGEKKVVKRPHGSQQHHSHIHQGVKVG
jgi:hypothetical protein